MYHGFPHRRGDVPTSNKHDGMLVKFSPQAWGCTEGRGGNVRGREVFPTGVGMYRHADVLDGGGHRFPHRRGDVPVSDGCTNCYAEFSPQAWGCTESFSATERYERVFPTGVGMYR